VGSKGHPTLATALNPNWFALTAEKGVPGETYEKIVVEGTTQPGVDGPQMTNVPFAAFEGSTVTFAMVIVAPTWLVCCAYWSGLPGSIVETVTTLAVRLIENMGTGTKLSGGEMEVIEEKLPFCAKPLGVRMPHKMRTQPRKPME
jgi:hypothetical protein